MNLRDFLLVAAGGAFGAMARYGVGVLCADLGRFPWGTLIVNVVGCFALGWFLQAAETSASISDATKLTIGTGFLGAFTTFSTFGVHTIHAWHQRSPMIAVANVAANVIIGLLAAILGIWLASRLHVAVQN